MANRCAWPILVRLTRHNRHSAAALMAVLEAELAPKLSSVRLARSVDAVEPPAVVLYSFMTSHVAAIQRELDALQDDRKKGLVLLAGGPHPSGDPSGALAMGFDAVVVGEAGRRFARAVGRAAQGKDKPEGVLPPEPPLALDTYPPWPQSGAVFAPIEIARGCPMGCAFCQTPQLFGRRSRYRSVASIRRAVAQSVQAGHRYTRFVTPNAFGYGSTDGERPNLRAIEAMLNAVDYCGMQRVYFGTFPSETRPEFVTVDVLELVRSRCQNRSIAVGIQSGSPEVLQRLKRGHTVDEAVLAVSRIAAAGFRPRVDFLFGLPGESEADQARTRTLMRHLAFTYGAQVHGHEFVPLPGSPLADAQPTAVAPQTRELLESLRGRGLATSNLMVWDAPPTDEDGTDPKLIC